MPQPQPRLATMALVAATVAVSFSAIFIRIANDDPATIVWLRMSLSAVILTPFALRDVRRQGLPRELSTIALVLASGILLAGHFILWTASLQYTSIAASVLLVSMHPVMVTPLGWALFGERPSGRRVAGMIVAMSGTAFTCFGDAGFNNSALSGDLLALGGAAALAGYLLIGRRVRRAISVASYSATTYAVVAACAAVTAGAGGTAHIPSGRVAALGAALAVVCTLAGHTVFNWALRRVPALTVSAAFLGEPPLASFLALALLATAPRLSTIIGGLIILGGVALVVVEPVSSQPAPAIALE